MNIQQILADLQAQRNRLDQAIAALEGIGGQKRGPGRPAKSSTAPARKPYRMSAAARKRISDAKRKWWAQQKKQKKK